MLAKELLSAGGVVAVKLAQMLAEDPKVPHVCLFTNSVLDQILIASHDLLIALHE